MDAGAVVEPEAQAQAGKKKRFQCEHCSRLFARLEHLQRHERIRECVCLNSGHVIDDMQTAE